MIKCQLDKMLTSEKSYRAHARDSGVNWPVFHRLLRNRTTRPDLGTLRKLRNYLGLPGETRWRLGEILAERGLTRMQVAEAVKCHPGTIGHLAGNTMQRADFGVMGRLCEYLELGSLEELLDTGGLLVWGRDGD